MSIDGRTIVVPVNDVINPQTVIRIENEGMVVEGRGEEKGNLYIKFDIYFPNFVSLENKERLKEILKDD